MLSYLAKQRFISSILLCAFAVLFAHSVVPHHHHDETPVATQHHDDEEQSSRLSHHDDDKDDHHGIFSFAQLDETFVPATSQNNSFELPITCLPALVATYLSDNFAGNTKAHFGWYKEYPPPEKTFPHLSHRGPPTA